MTGSLILTRWTGEAFEPTPRFRKYCDQHYVIGEVYRAAPEEERSLPNHNHYMAAVAEAWRNLPEDIADQYPTDDHLRRRALIQAGYCDQRSIVCASKAEALRVASFTKPLDEYAVVVVKEAVVTVYTAHSQSFRAMGEETFKASKEAVLDILAGMVGVETRELESAPA